MLKGQAKKDYQREYMRRLRLKSRLLDPSVRPNVQPNATFLHGEAIATDTVRIELDADGNPIYDETHQD